MKHLQNILIAGCGYIGKKVAHQLQQRQIPFGALVNSANSLLNCQKQAIQVSTIDLDREASTPASISARTILYFIPPQPQGITDQRISRFLQQINMPPDNFVLISTTGVYGDCKGRWINEDSELKPQADRARRRLSAEQQAQDYCRDSTSLSILRVAGIYAADKLPLKRIKSGEAILREADSGYSNRIHADDLVQICIQAAVENNLQGVYNCSDGQPSSMCDYFVRVARACNLKAPKQITLAQAKQQLSPGMLSYLLESRRIDNSKLLQGLSHALQYPDLESGLKNICSS